MRRHSGKVGFIRAITLGIIGALTTLGMAVTAGPAGAQVFRQPPAGAVYPQTNAVPNSVEIYRRSFTGALTPAGAVLTGGNGVSPRPSRLRGPSRSIAAIGSCSSSTAVATRSRRSS